LGGLHLVENNTIMTTQQIANRFYELAQQGSWEQIQDELFSTEAKSIEPPGSEGLSNVEGIDGIKRKAAEWNNMVEATHGGYCNQPQVAGKFFTCTMGADVTIKGQGRTTMDEVALYQVKDGKIVSEQFFY
jgi:hypothetical protein